MGSLLETACHTFSARALARLFPPFLSDPPPLPRPWNTAVYYHTKSLLVRRSQIFNVISALVEKKKGYGIRNFDCLLMTVYREK